MQAYDAIRARQADHIQTLMAAGKDKFSSSAVFGVPKAEADAPIWPMVAVCYFDAFKAKVVDGEIDSAVGSNDYSLSPIWTPLDPKAEVAVHNRLGNSTRKEVALSYYAAVRGNSWKTALEAGVLAAVVPEPGKPPKDMDVTVGWLKVPYGKTSAGQSWMRNYALVGIWPDPNPNTDLP